jgi:hypothetical protein
VPLCWAWWCAPLEPGSRAVDIAVPDQLAGDPTDAIVSRFVNQDSRIDDHSWRFLTNHAHVLERVAGDRTVRLRDIAASVGITERAASTIVNDLVAAGYLSKTRIGRRNTYEVHDELPLRHPLHRHHTVRELIEFLEGPADASRRTG